MHSTRALACLACAAALLAPGSAFALGFQITTDFTQEYVDSPPNPASSGANHLQQRDWALSTHLRFSTDLMTRHDRPFQLLFGPGFRFPFVFAMTGYGKDIEGASAPELDAEIGFNWYGYLRTLLTVSPSWTLSYLTTDLHPTQPTEHTEVDWSHLSVGVRVEIPVYTLESEPGDQRVQFGPILYYGIDRMSGLTLKPVDYTPDPSDPITYNQKITGTQNAGARWMLGAFVNVKL